MGCCPRIFLVYLTILGGWQLKVKGSRKKPEQWTWICFLLYSTLTYEVCKNWLWNAMFKVIYLLFLLPLLSSILQSSHMWVYYTTPPQSHQMWYLKSGSVELVSYVQTWTLKRTLRKPFEKETVHHFLILHLYDDGLIKQIPIASHLLKSIWKRKRLNSFILKYFHLTILLIKRTDGY